MEKRIAWFYKYNEVDKFEMSRRVKKPGKALLHCSLRFKELFLATAGSEKKKEGLNEFVDLWLKRTVMTTADPLPGLLKFFPVQHSTTVDVSPLEVRVCTTWSPKDPSPFATFDAAADLASQGRSDRLGSGVIAPGGRFGSQPRRSGAPPTSFGSGTMRSCK